MSHSTRNIPHPLFHLPNTPYSILLLFLTIIGTTAFLNRTTPKKTVPETLSSYGFFKGPLKDLQPAEGVIPYDLNTPLFSNYAEKLRFIKIPEGQSAVYNDKDIFELPKGTVIIKHFYYPDDFRSPEKGRRILETRLLIHEESGWEAYPYIWNIEQTDAIFEPAGDGMDVDYINAKGKKINLRYVVPNYNQCKGCHQQDGKFVPIGIAARHLNGSYDYADGRKNQLQYWKEQNLLSRIPEKEIPANASWYHPGGASIEDRARAYLDINCGHCHNPKGPANTSGLFLDIHTKDPTALGIQKTPVAAGRGSGNLQFDIVPGKPQESILLYRMRSNDPGIAMPEIGREHLHTEGIALIEEWIRTMH